MVRLAHLGISTMRVEWYMYAGLKEFANEQGLDEEDAKLLLQTANTIRGKFPTTVEEWRTLYDAIQVVLNPRGE